MNVILVPGGRTAKGQNACLTTRHLLVIGLVGLVGFPALVGFLTYRIQSLLDRDAGGQAALLAAQERALAVQRTEIDQVKRQTQTHLNALARRMGQLQAEVLRLNALGQRLTRMAGIDPREFNFNAEPAMGGPERTSVTSVPLDVGATLERLGSEIDRKRERLAALESLLLDRKVNAAVTPAGWPVEGGWVSSGFGMRADPFTGQQSFHEGVDIATRMGSEILAMGDGVVSHSGEKTGYGLMVEVTHESGLVTRYAHVRTALAKVGDRVSRGQTIALVGSTGRSTGPHLHFEVVRNGQPVNPARYLQHSAPLTQLTRAPAERP